MKNNRGMIFVTALVMMAILLALGTGYVISARTNLRISSNEMDIVRSFYYAEAGVEEAIAYLKMYPDGMSMPMGGNLDTMGGPTQYNISYDSTQKKIISTGFSMSGLGATRSIEVQLVKPFTGALQVGGMIWCDWPGTPAVGTITGDVDAGTSINLTSLTIADGDETDGNTGLFVPTPDWTEYANALNYPAGINFHTVDETAFTAVDNATDTFTKTNNVLSEGSRIKIGGTTVPTGIVPGTNYYVVNIAGNNFQVSETKGGAPVDFTDDGSSVTFTRDLCYDLDQSNPPAGIYFLRSSCTFGVSNFNLAGSIIDASGSLLLTGMTGSMTINPPSDAFGKKYPAIMVNGSLTINQAFNANINGLIYSTGDMKLSVWDLTSVINGAVVTKGNLDLVAITNLTLDFDANTDPPYFDAPPLEVDSWQLQGI